MENHINHRVDGVINMALGDAYLQRILYVLVLIFIFILFSIKNYNDENLTRILLDRAAFFIAYYNITFSIFRFFVWFKAIGPQGFISVDINSIWYKFHVVIFIGSNTVIYGVIAYYAYKLFISY